MANKMIDFLKTIIETIWEFHSELADIATIIGLLFAFSGVIVAYFEYRNNRNAKQEAERPYIFIDLDTSVFNICTLVLKNIGTSPAKDIKILFTPNIELRKDQLINDLGIFKHLSFLSPNRDISFFLGTFMEDKIKQKFEIALEYKDLKGKKYTEKQTLNPSEYLGLSHVNKKDLNDVAKYLEEIKKSIKSMSDNSNKLLESWKNGLLIRNLHFDKLTLDEKLQMVSAIVLSGNKEDTWLNPFVYDLKILVKSIRDDLLSKKKLSKRENDIVIEANKILKHLMTTGDNSEYYNALESISSLVNSKKT